MKLKIKDLLRGNENEEYLSSEIMSSLKKEAIDIGITNGEHDIKLVINGIEHDPLILKNIFENIEKYIDQKANEIIYDKKVEIDDKADFLLKIIEEASIKIADQYNIDLEDM